MKKVDIDMAIANAMRATAKEYVDVAIAKAPAIKEDWDKISSHITPEEADLLRQMMMCTFLAGGTLCARDETFREGFATYGKVMSSQSQSERYIVGFGKGKEE